jgi:hypothetical protein
MSGVPSWSSPNPKPSVTFWYSDKLMRLCEASARKVAMPRCSTRVARSRKFALACCTLCFFNAACDDLPAIPGRTCGNRVIDEGEECDDFPSDACHAPDTPNACLIDCRAAACPEGAGCGLDGVCRTPSGWTSPFGLRSGVTGAPLLNGDFDGDGRKDLLVLDNDRALLSFDAQRQLRVMSAAGLSSGTMLVSRIDGDDRDDVVTYSEAQLSLMRGSSSGLIPLPQMLATPPAESQRVLSLGPDRELQPLLLADRNLLRIPLVGEDFGPLGTLEVAAGDIAGEIQRLTLPQSQGCSSFVLAERGASSVRVYGVCATLTDEGSARILSTVALPAPALVGPSGALVGDVDGDGIDDLLIAVDAATDDFGEAVHVAYGVGNGNFQSLRLGTAGAGADATANELLTIADGRLLQAAHLDGDAFVDLITANSIVFGRGSTASCGLPEKALGPCTLFHDEHWVAAAAADFTRDGNIDVIGIPRAARSLTVLLGAGGGVFNRHVIRAGAQVDAAQLTEERSTVLAVGDYDGDLTTDLAFTMLDPAEAPSGRVVAILYGKTSSIPSEIQTVGSLGDVQELVTANVSFFSESSVFAANSTASDLLFRTRIGGRDAVGFLVGQTAFGASSSSPSTVGGDLMRILTSPLLFPNLGSDTNDPTFIGALALGAFTGRAERREAVALAITLTGDGGGTVEEPSDGFDEADTSLALAFIENGEAGLAIVDPKQSPFEFPGELSRSIKRRLDESLTDGPVMQALDLDADGVDELILCDTHIVQGQLAYLVIRRQGGAWSSEEHRVEVLGAGDLALRPTPWGEVDASDRHLGGPIDIDLDGKSDLVARGDREAGALVVVLRNGGSGTLSDGRALELDPSVRAAAFANIDDDRALELVAGGERGVQFYDVDVTSGALQELAADIPSGAVSALSVGDFDGDGISDVATSGEMVTVYFGGAGD